MNVSLLNKQDAALDVIETDGLSSLLKKEFKPKTEAPAKKPIDATMFRKAYDELRAEFADELDSVKEYLGGWTSTLVINRSK